MPTVVHWGADLGVLDHAAQIVVADSAITAVGPSSVDHPMRPSLVPLLSDGWNGQPGIDGFHATSHQSAPPTTQDSAPAASRHGIRRPSLKLAEVTSISDTAVVVKLVDDHDGVATLSLTHDIKLSQEGLLRQRSVLTNLSEAPFHLASMTLTSPLHSAAVEQLDFTGIWAGERAPQRGPIKHGTWLRESRHGRPGHDDSFLLAVGTPGFGFRTGQVWAHHLGWSGDKRTFIDSSATGHRIVGLGELLAPGEITLAQSEQYETPWLYSAYSDRGLDAISDRFHEWFRRLPAHPSTPRPLTLNTWEAVYFDQSIERLGELARVAASVGVERFVLDDGWMTGRTDAARALGDWSVDLLTWPDGLHPLVDTVTELGMQFGLWVEPEMISEDSELARAHPEWILRESSAKLPLSWRDQYVLDLSVDAARSHVLESLSALLDEYPISYLKWDMNRDLLGGSSHKHVLATWQLMDELAARHPDLEIESCASGGGRIDAGILERTQRVWPSDTNDSLDRQQIYRSTVTLVPPEYLGSHVGSPSAHTTGRTHGLGFRLATALFGHAGIEWDLSTTTELERTVLGTWAAAYKKHRSLIHSGRVVRHDDTGDGRLLHGVVSPDQQEALYLVSWTGSSPVSLQVPLRFPGLDATASYTVRLVDLGAGEPRRHGRAPRWWDDGEITTTGSVLAEIGLPLPVVMVEQAQVLHLTQSQ